MADEVLEKKHAWFVNWVPKVSLVSFVVGSTVWAICVLFLTQKELSHAERFGVVGSYASLLGLIVTGWLAWEARKIRQFYRRHILLPGFVNDLKKHVKNAKTFLSQKNSDEVKISMRKCDAILERIPEFADKLLNQRVASARSAINDVVEHSGSTVLSNSAEAIGKVGALIESATAFTNANKWST